MPKQVDHGERREAIARALWTLVDEQGWTRATMREIANAAGVSLGQMQHYFSSRAELLAFGMEFAAHETSRRVERGLASLDQPPHPREVLRVVLVEQLPLHSDARATSRMHAAYVMEAMHDPSLQRQIGVGLREGRDLVERLVREAIDAGQIAPDRDPEVETDLILALTGFAALLDLGVVEPDAALAAIDQHLDGLFRRTE